MRGRLLYAGLTSALLVMGSAAVAPSSQAAAPVACPDALPTEQAVDGLVGTGYTVDRGTTPAPFTATLLGRITDGIAPGIDLIMADLDSPAIDAAGVWAGMSGSPVYTSDGLLIGSVSYGLAAASPIAGITPGAEMKKLLDLSSTSVSAADRGVALGADKVPVTATVAKQLAATGDATLAQASAGFQRLPLPISVSGLSGVSAGHGQAELDRLSKRIPNARMLFGSAAATGGNTAADIVPGGNFAAALSYGDATLAGIGTTTFVCDGQAVAFGHPFLFTGPTNMSVHPATALFVQPDPVFGSFKVANIGSPVGTLDQDRLAGVRGQLGTVPLTARISSTLTAVGGGTRTGTTRLVYQPFAPDVTAIHTFTNIDRVLDAITPGTATVTTRIVGLREDGTPFVVNRTDSYADPFDISFAVAFGIADQLFAIVNQQFEKVTITSVNITGTVDPTFRDYRVGSLQVEQDGTFVTPTGSVTAPAGSTLAVRLGLIPLGGGAASTLDLAVPVPDAAGTTGSLTIDAGPAFLDVFSATSLDEILAAIRALPQSNSARGTLNVTTDSGTLTTSASATADRVIEQYSAGLDVEIT